MEKIKTEIIEYLEKEINKLEKHINYYYDILNKESISFFLQNSANTLVALNNRIIILKYIKTDITECITLDTKAKLVAYFQDKIDELTESLYHNISHNTNPMFNLINQWIREDAINIRSHYRSCLNIINKYK